MCPFQRLCKARVRSCGDKSAECKFSNNGKGDTMSTPGKMSPPPDYASLSMPSLGDLPPAYADLAKAGDTPGTGSDVNVAWVEEKEALPPYE